MFEYGGGEGAKSTCALFFLKYFIFRFSSSKERTVETLKWEGGEEWRMGRIGGALL